MNWKEIKENTHFEDGAYLLVWCVDGDGNDWPEMMRFAAKDNALILDHSSGRPEPWHRGSWTDGWLRLALYCEVERPADVPSSEMERQ